MLKITKWLFVIMFFSAQMAFAQAYPENYERFSFAQTYLGIGQMSFSEDIETSVLRNGELEEVSLRPNSETRLTIGALHFWGFADAYVSFPIRSETKEGDLSISYTHGIETGFRFYPIPISLWWVSPFVGIAWNPLNYLQSDDGEKGAEITKNRTSWNYGLVWATPIGMLEAGVQKINAHRLKIDYYITRDQAIKVKLPEQSIWAGYKYSFETTAGAADPSRIQVTGNNLTVGIGGVFAWVQGESSYLEEERPFLHQEPISDLALDLAVGWWWREKETQFNISYREFTNSQDAFGLKNTISQTNTSLEVYSFIFDYQGFDPYIGLSLNQVEMSYYERDEGKIVWDKKETVNKPGLITGWDIRPTMNQFFVLRTNIRYTPDLEMELEEGKKVKFYEWELDLIQVVFHFF